MYHIVKRGETLAGISRNYRRSIPEILAANPHLKNANNFFPGQVINIPRLPDPNTIRYQIDVSLKRKRLTLMDRGRVIKTYPVGIGKMLTKTPVGTYVIVNRQPNPGGPFGVMWLSLSKAGYGIHGTNNPASIGKAVSHGCIRMHNKDVLELAAIVSNGTRVSIHP